MYAMPRTFLRGLSGLGCDGLWLACTALAVFAVPSRADQDETLIRLNVPPAPAPKPALRYLLLPDLSEMSPGNPIQHYMKSCMEERSFFFDKAAYDRREPLLAMPLRELPAAELQEYGRSALAEADRAARLDNPDWQTLMKLKADGFGLLLPEVQQLRGLARALQARFRAEVAQGRVDDALRTAKTMFAMSRHLGEHPTFIGGLVGIAIAAVAIGPLEELLEQPGSPNLYWALTNLPSPFMRLDTGAAGERMSLMWAFRDLDAHAPMTAEQIKACLLEKDKLLDLADKPTGGVRKYLDDKIKDPAQLSAARARLVDFGFAAELLRRFPPEQVVLLDEKLQLEIHFDDFVKFATFPTWQAEALLGPAEPKKTGVLFVDAFTPSLRSVKRAQGRIDQRIALLRHVEALRMFAALHSGSLPTKLSEITVPLPDDPFTGKPFRYELVKATAHVRGTPPAGLKNVVGFNVHYEITIDGSRGR
jgi:hypothetical protein